MRTLLLTIVLVLQPISSYWAQSYELIVEEFAVDIVEGYTTYRFYQSMENEDDYLGWHKHERFFCFGGRCKE